MTYVTCRDEGNNDQDDADKNASLPIDCEALRCGCAQFPFIAHHVLTVLSFECEEQQQHCCGPYDHDHGNARVGQCEDSGHCVVFMRQVDREDQHGHGQSLHKRIGKPSKEGIFNGLEGIVHRGRVKLVAAGHKSSQENVTRKVQRPHSPRAEPRHTDIQQQCLQTYKGEYTQPMHVAKDVKGVLESVSPNAVCCIVALRLAGRC